jgi:hypothetical protein
VRNRALWLEADPAKQHSRRVADPVVAGANASEYPITAQTTPTTPSDTKLIIIVFSAFFERTRPP